MHLTKILDLLYSVYRSGISTWSIWLFKSHQGTCWSFYHAGTSLSRFWAIDIARHKGVFMGSQQFISQDAAPANHFVTASCTFSIPFEETKRNHLIELHDLKFNELIAKYELPLPEIVQSQSCTDINLILPTSTLLVGLTCLPLRLPSLFPNSTVSLNIDFILHHEGMYEIRLRAEGINGSEQRRVFKVIAVDN